jgi:hypothetical protein
MYGSVRYASDGQVNALRIVDVSEPIVLTVWVSLVVIGAFLGQVPVRR